jgi:hypothetical protein
VMIDDVCEIDGASVGIEDVASDVGSCVTISMEFVSEGNCVDIGGLVAFDGPCGVTEAELSKEGNCVGVGMKISVVGAFVTIGVDEKVGKCSISGDGATQDGFLFGKTIMENERDIER